MFKTPTLGVDTCSELGFFLIIKSNISQMNPKEAFHNTAYSVQLPYIAGHSLNAIHIFGGKPF